MTYWIVKLSSGRLFITIHPNLYKNAVGPFWTFEEAVKVLNYWIEGGK